MKKLLIGFIISVVVSLPVGVFANYYSIVGEVVDGVLPLFIDGEKSSKDVIVIDGTSYLPVRAAGEMFGYDVGFANGEVLLTKKQEIKEVTASDPQKLYYFRSNEINLWYIYNTELSQNLPEELLPYLVLDGNTYVPLQLFNHYREEQEDGSFTFTLPNDVTKNIKMTGSEKYEKDCLVFVYKEYRSKSYVNLTELGYTIREDGDILWIE